MQAPRYSKLQQEAKKAFGSSKLGKLLTATQRDVERGVATAKTLMQAGHQLNQITGSDATRSLMQEMGLGQVWHDIERYAGKDIWKNIVGSMGSVGKLLKALSDSAKRRGKENIEPREVKLAADLLRAFGYHVVAPGNVKAELPEHAPLDPRIQEIIEEQEEKKKNAGKPKSVSEKLKEKFGPFGEATETDAQEEARLRELDRLNQINPQHRAMGFETPEYEFQTEMIEVQSTNVHSIGFRYEDRDTGTLLVRFLATNADGSRSEPGSLYEYFQVPAVLFERFKQAGSKGGFVWDNLRIRGTISGHQYNYDLTGITGGYVPRRAQLQYFRGKRGGLRATETFTPRSFQDAKVEKGKFKIYSRRSQLGFQRVGKSFSASRGGQ